MTSVLHLKMFEALPSFLPNTRFSFVRGYFGFPQKAVFAGKDQFFSRCGCFLLAI